MKMRQSKIRLAMVLAAVSMSNLAAAEPASPAIQATKLGQCLVKTSRSNAIALFGRLPSDETSVDPSVMQNGAGAACATGGSTVSGMQVRGAIAEALYERDFRDAGMSPHRELGNLARLDLPEGAADTTGIFALGRCVARARFADVDKLFATEPGSRRESNFIDTLMPYFSACQPRGTRTSFRRGDIRPLMAQSAYVGNVRYWFNKTAAR